MAVMVSGSGGGGETWVNITSALSVQTYASKLYNGVTGTVISSIKGVAVDPAVYGRKFRVRTRLSSDSATPRPAPWTYYVNSNAYWCPVAVVMSDSAISGNAYTCYMEYIAVVPPSATELYFPVLDTSDGIIVERAV